ncbi:MAG: CxxC-x17-CxxC domain-containing protein [Nanoarchaeota archaeon]
MHKIKCSECGADSEVPFQPKEGRPVFCRDCYSKKRQRY